MRVENELEVQLQKENGRRFFDLSALSKELSFRRASSLRTKLSNKLYYARKECLMNNPVESIVVLVKIWSIF